MRQVFGAELAPGDVLADGRGVWSCWEYGGVLVDGPSWRNFLRVGAAELVELQDGPDDVTAIMNVLTVFPGTTVEGWSA